jgi:glycolate oxidase iron-sulfur subunit
MKPVPSLSSGKLFDLAHQDANKCVQCGYCLPVCPTYASMGKETASPRGRINLVKLAAEGKIGILEHVAGPLDLCLGCRACEVACPVGVPYGHILESAKEAIFDEKRRNEEAAAPVAGKPGGWIARKVSGALQRIVTKHLFPHPRRLRLAGNLVWLYQKSGATRLVRRSGVIRRISPAMAEFEKVLPEVDSPRKRPRAGARYPAVGPKKATVAFFSGCLMDAMMHRTNRLGIELLRLSGCEVVIPAAQTCCGALYAHQGDKETARRLAEANIEAFERTGADWYVNNAGGCGAMLQEYGRLFREEEAMGKRAAAFAAKSRDITWILHRFGPLPFKKKREFTITYQDSCHLRNVQQVHEEPRALIRSIPGAKFVDYPGADSCCASGGIYNLLHFEESMRILDDKMESIKRTNASVLVTTNPGCLLQMRQGIARSGLGGTMRAVHLVDVLAEACGIE